MGDGSQDRLQVDGAGCTSPKRVKRTDTPPKVCDDCFWRRAYQELEAQFLSLRRANIELVAKSKNRPAPVSRTLPRSQMIDEIDDRRDLGFIDRLTREEDR